MPDLDHELSLVGESNYQRIKPSKRIDLFLFYKECLINILRHSKATTARSFLEISEFELSLTVSDNGHGISSKTTKEPPSLKRRARLLGANLEVSPADSSGTTVKLHMKL